MQGMGIEDFVSFSEAERKIACGLSRVNSQKSGPLFVTLPSRHAVALQKAAERFNTPVDRVLELFLDSYHDIIRKLGVADHQKSHPAALEADESTLWGVKSNMRVFVQQNCSEGDDTIEEIVDAALKAPTSDLKPFYQSKLRIADDGRKADLFWLVGYCRGVRALFIGAENYVKAQRQLIRTKL